MDVIDGRGGPYEPLCTEDFLGIERTVGTTELDMSLGGKFAKLGVVGHGVISRLGIVRLAP